MPPPARSTRAILIHHQTTLSVKKPRLDPRDGERRLQGRHFEFLAVLCIAITCLRSGVVGGNRVGEGNGRQTNGFSKFLDCIGPFQRAHTRHFCIFFFGQRDIMDTAVIDGPCELALPVNFGGEAGISVFLVAKAFWPSAPIRTPPFSNGCPT